VAATIGDTETHLFARLTSLTNLDLRLCCYDLTSTYFESVTADPDGFPSKKFGYSRDHRSDRQQVMIGCWSLVTGSRSHITCSPETPTTPPRCRR
jgi:transposase